MFIAVYGLNVSRAWAQLVVKAKVLYEHRFSPLRVWFIDAQNHSVLLKTNEDELVNIIQCFGVATFTCRHLFEISKQYESQVQVQRVRKIADSMRIDYGKMQTSMRCRRAIGIELCKFNNQWLTMSKISTITGTRGNWLCIQRLRRIAFIFRRNTNFGAAEAQNVIQKTNSIPKIGHPMGQVTLLASWHTNWP